MQEVFTVPIPSWRDLFSSIQKARFSKRNRWADRHRRPPCQCRIEVLEDRFLPSLFQSALTTPTGGNNPFGVAVGDFNGDHRLDVAVTNNGSGTLSIGLGNGDGTFTKAFGSPLVVGSSAQAVAVGDFNGDGRQDIAVADPADNRVVFFFGNGNGTFQIPFSVAVSGRPISLAVGDFNKDGFDDLAVGTQNGQLGIIFGGTSFTSTTVSTSTGAVTALVTADFNNDGKLDIAAARELTTGTSVSIFLGNGLGGFTLASGSPIALTATGATSLAVGDFEGIGLQDLAVANFTDNTVTLLPGNGDGTFASPTILSVPGQPFSVATGDFNLDGQVDLLTANNANNNVTALLGNGDLTFQAAQNFAVGTAPLAMAVGDFNGDGAPDLVVANNGTATGAGSSISVLLNASTPIHFAISAPASVMAGTSFSITVSAEDTSNNVLTTYRGRIRFTSSDSFAVLPPDYAFTTADAGVHTFTVTLQTSGSQTITVNQLTHPSFRGTVTVTVNNPAPTLTSLSQNSAVEGSASILLMVNGTNFVHTSVVEWNGTALATTYVSSTQLNATIPASDVAEEGTNSVTVFNPAPGGGTSGSLPFTVTDAGLTATGTTLNATEGIGTGGTVATFVDANPGATTSDFPAGSVTIAWGDGVTTSGTVSQPGGPGTKFFVQGFHTYAEEGAATITVSITDMGGAMASTTSSATIADAPLSVSAAPIKVMPGVPFSGQVATFTDANPAGTLSDFTGAGGATINWGDGTTSPGVVTQPGGVGTAFVVSGTHTYTTPGNHIFTVTVTDVGGSTASGKAVAGNFKAHDIVGRQSGEWWVGLSNGSTAFNSAKWASWDPTITWVDAVTGDFNGDGRTDIAARNLQTGDWYVGISTGSSFTTTVWTSWSPNVTWVDVKVGDFNGDGKDDIIGRVQQSGEWWLAQSTGASFTNSKWSTWSSAVTWVDVQVGDFNGDHKADITGRELKAGNWWTGLSTGSSFNTTLWASWSPNVTWVDVRVGDFNGDGKSDITGRVLQSGEWWTGISTGSSFNTTLWTTWSAAVTWVDVRVGDFNGDGSSDIIGRDKQTGRWQLATSNGSTAFTNSLYDTWSPAVTWVDVQVGDFNGDGRDDITGRVLQSGEWWTSLSNGSKGTSTLWATWSPAVRWVDVHTGVFV
jgi:hypothetical protein